MSTRPFSWLLLGIQLAWVSPALACTLCGNAKNASTIREDALQAKMILFGELKNARPDNVRLGGGTTELHIMARLKSDPFLGNKKMIVIPRFIPSDPRKPAPKFVVFCDVFKGKLIANRGIPAEKNSIPLYVRQALRLDPKDSTKRLLHFFQFLDHANPELADDAYREFAKASDKEVGEVAPRLSRDRLRKLMVDSRTPAGRIGLYAFLLGASGNGEDAVLLRSLAIKRTSKNTQSLSGILAGYIQLEPKAGWELTWDILHDSNAPLAKRIAAVNSLRFIHRWRGEKAKRNIIRGLEVILPQGDLADLAIEDLRLWQYWDLTPVVLALYGKKSHNAPIMRRAIIRYGLSCPRSDAKRFIDQRRRIEPKLIKEVEDALQFEKKKPR